MPFLETFAILWIKKIPRTMSRSDTAILLVSCRDQKGLTATVAQFIYDHNGNILHADQHTDEQSKTFFMRVEWQIDDFQLEEGQITDVFAEIAAKFSMTWNLYFAKNKPRAAIFVSRHLHCAYDLLYRYRAGHLPCEIPILISNHIDAKPLAGEFGIEFHHIPISPETKSSQEKKEVALLEKAGVDLVILARYHQILTEKFIQQFFRRIINIHHSFLPAFAGKNPYVQAYEKGVKIIGATSHYVTADLDQGPIIEQSTVRISHRDSLEDLKRKSEDLERVVLNRAVLWHLCHKILCYANKTVVFD
jgi:formyltetrahydrofolate deformylase